MRLIAYSNLPLGKLLQSTPTHPYVSNVSSVKSQSNCLRYASSYMSRISCVSRALESIAATIEYVRARVKIRVSI